MTSGAEKRQAVDDWLRGADVGALLADGLDDAILGIVEIKGFAQPVICYDLATVIRLHEAMGMDPEEAEEFVAYNVTDSYQGPGTPAFLIVPWEAETELPAPPEPSEPDPPTDPPDPPASFAGALYDPTGDVSSTSPGTP